MSTPSLDELLALAHPVSLPLVTPFRGIARRDLLVFDAPDGSAEWSPFVEYDDQESSIWLRSTLEQGWNQKSLPLPDALPDSITVNGTVPALPASEVPAYLATLGPVVTVKVKVAGPSTSLEMDSARVAAVREVLGPTGRIRLDANGAWNLDEAEHALRMMEHLDIDYIEQPVETVTDMAELRRRVTRMGIQVAADESIRRWSDIHTVLDQDAADIIVVKVAPLGGILRTLEVVNTASSKGVEVVVSSALESSVGMSYGVLLQQILITQRGHAEAAGLGTVSLFEGDIVTHPLIAHGGKLEATSVDLDPGALQKYQMAPEDASWWLERLKRCYSLI